MKGKMITAEREGVPISGYWAQGKPASPGVLVFHAWWGLTDFIKQTCDQLAEEGFTVFAPDLHFGQLVNTIPEAQAIMDAGADQKIEPLAHQVVPWFAEELQKKDAALKSPPPIGIVGYSMGAAWAVNEAWEYPDLVKSVVVYYGHFTFDYGQLRCRLLGHFAETDPFEPQEEVDDFACALEIAGAQPVIYQYPGTGHWFVEADRPEAYQKDAAELAWSRTVAYLKATLGAAGA